jgi:hypothetical protein
MFRIPVESKAGTIVIEETAPLTGARRMLAGLMLPSL